MEPPSPLSFRKVKFKISEDNRPGSREGANGNTGSGDGSRGPGGDFLEAQRKILGNSGSSNVNECSRREVNGNEEDDGGDESDVTLSKDTEIDVNEDLDESNSKYFTPMAKSPKSRRRVMKESLGFREIHDLTRLDVITLENVLECLRERYRLQEYYTYAGPILLSLNSCQRIPRASLVENVSRMSEYFHSREVDSRLQKENGGGSSTVKTKTQQAPHVYDIGKQCLRNLMNVGSHQIVLITGESGAGKTTATQQLVKYLTENNSRNFGKTNCSYLDKKIYFATLILESFGNAKTQQNPNSSRFGRLIQLNYEKMTGRINGAEIQTYLLEKHRVAKYNYECERSFYIFYYVLLGLENGMITLPQVMWSTIKKLVPDHFLKEALECDLSELERLRTAIDIFALNNDFVEIASILVAIVVLLNITFVPADSEEASDDDEFCSNNESPSIKEFTVSDRSCTELAADLLGVNESELVGCLIARKITAGRGITRRQSIFRKPCESALECEARLHSLISFLYDRLFAQVLEYLNSNLTGDRSLDFNDLTTLSLLDMYGFENFNVNHLEQICINYANERLQQINVSIVKSYYEQSVLEDEVRVPATELIKIEGELQLRIGELHNLVFAFLNEECLLSRNSNDEELKDKMRANLKKADSKFIRMGKPLDPGFKFTVCHYATDVQYQLAGVIQKNKDHIPPEFQDILQSSSKNFTSSMFQVDPPRNINDSCSTPRSPYTVSSNIKTSRGKTILTRFKASVEELLGKLKSTENNDIHFIRCIRPNEDLLAGTFLIDLVKKQLHACGIADVVKIAGNGYPIRIHSSKFLKEFPKIMIYFCKRRMDPKILSLVFSQCGNKKPIKFGKQMVFLSEESWKLMKKTELRLAAVNAGIIERAWKAFLIKRDQLNESSVSQQSTESTLVKDSTSVSHISANLEEQDEGFHEDSKANKDTTNANETDVPPKPSKLIRKPNLNLQTPLYYGNGIVSRNPVHTLPIKIYTKKTCLAFVEKPPRRLIPNGIHDAFEDHGINFIPDQVS